MNKYTIINPPVKHSISFSIKKDGVVVGILECLNNRIIYTGELIFTCVEYGKINGEVYTFDINNTVKT